MAYAWVENGAVRDVTLQNPADIFVGQVAALYSTKVANNIRPGATLVGGVWTNIPPGPPPGPPPPYVAPFTPIAFKLRFTSAERITIRAQVANTGSPDDVLNDWWEILNDPTLTEVDPMLESTVEAVQYLAAKGYINKDRIQAILGWAGSLG